VNVLSTMVRAPAARASAQIAGTSLTLSNGFDIASNSTAAGRGVCASAATTAARSVVSTKRASTPNGPSMVFSSVWLDP
jgi:hypothetical protein